MSLISDMIHRAETLLGCAVTQSQRLHGGDLSDVLQLSLSDGRTVVVKSGPDPQAEAHMLQAMAATGAPVPAVLACDATLLVLQALPQTGSLHAAWGDLGQAVGQLHRAGSPSVAKPYGWDRDYAFGSLPIGNRRADNWPAFWAEQRLAVHLPHLPTDLGRRLEQLCRDLPRRLPTQPPVALLHGDLWTGNVLVDGARISGLIDPACYYGHGEVDLAMLALFGTPTPEFYAAYGPLEPGWRDRAPIYSLWPALVHIRLFGAGYRSMVEGFLTQAGV
ncbi:MAG: fructosamine kinase family protein [Rhodospirillaceae bacterium]